MELYPHVYQVQSLFAGRNLFQYLFVGDNTVLVDTGVAQTPEKVIFPYMDSLGVKLQRLTLAVTTHADVDIRAAITRLNARLPAHGSVVGLPTAPW